MNYLLSQEQFAFLKNNSKQILVSENNPSIFIFNNKVYSKKHAAEVLTESVAGILGSVGDWASMGIEAIADMVDGWGVKDWLHLGVDFLAAVMGVIFPGIGSIVVEAAHIVWWGFEYYDADQNNDDALKTEAALNISALAMLGIAFPVVGAAGMALLKAPFKVMGKVVGVMGKTIGKEVVDQEVKFAVKQTVGKETVTHFMTKAQLDAFAKSEPALYNQALKEGNVIGNFFKRMGQKIGPKTVDTVEIKTMSLLEKWSKSLGTSTWAKPFKFILTVLDFLRGAIKNIFNSFRLMLVLIGRTPAVDVLDQEYLSNSIEDLTHAGMERFSDVENSRKTLLVPIKFQSDKKYESGIFLISLRLKSFESLSELTEEKVNKKAPCKEAEYYHVVGSKAEILPVFLVYAKDKENGKFYTAYMKDNMCMWSTAEELSSMVGFKINFEIVPVDTLDEGDKKLFDETRKQIGFIDKEKIKKFSNFRKALIDTGIFTDPKLTGERYKLPEIEEYRKSLKR